MTCHEFWDRMPELERDPARLEHEHQCSSCAALLADQRALAAGYPPNTTRTGDLTTASVRSESANNDLLALDSDFIAAPYASGAVPAEDTDWVRLEVPRSALIALGLPVAVDAGSGRVEAEIALSANGVVQGVRLLQ